MAATTELAATIRVEYAALAGRDRLSALVRLGPADSGAPVIWDLDRLRSFAEAIDDVAQHDVEAVVLLGSSHSFGVGADVGMLAGAADPDDARRIAEAGWDAFRRLGDLPTPTFAVITGFALGGGLELALFADHRIARGDTRAIGLPEVRLGLVPGWGGIHNLVRIAGPRVAYDLAVRDSRRGAVLDADAAGRLGVVDLVLPAAEWDETWPGVVGTLVDSPVKPHRPPSSAAEEAADLAAVRRDLARSRPSVSAAPQAAVELIDRATHETMDEAQASTSTAFADLLLSDAGRASLYASRIARSRSRTPAHLAEVAGRPIERAAVIGAGLMASQLATLLVRFGGIPVVLTDLDQDRADRGADLVRGRLAEAAAHGDLSAADAGRLGALVSGSADPAAVAGADFVIEAIFEDLAAKRTALAAAERHVAADAVLATNTSSLSLQRMADGLRHPERLVGFHIFNPIEAVPLVEIIRGPKTDDRTVATVLALADRLRRRAIVARDSPGFVVNRLLTRLLDVVLTGIDAGGDPLVIDRSIDDLGLPMTPLRLLDFIGPAVQLHIGETMHEAFPDRFARPGWLARVVDAGERSVLQLDQTLTPEVVALLPPRAADLQDLGDRTRTAILDALSDEVDRMLDEQVVELPEDIDTAMILGANYPWALGGLTPYLAARKRQP